MGLPLLHIIVPSYYFPSLQVLQAPFEDIQNVFHGLQMICEVFACSAEDWFFIHGQPQVIQLIANTVMNVHNRIMLEDHQCSRE